MPASDEFIEWLASVVAEAKEIASRYPDDYCVQGDATYLKQWLDHAKEERTVSLNEPAMRDGVVKIMANLHKWDGDNND